MTYRNSTPQRLPEKYYQRRRIAAVVALLAVIALLVWGLSAFARSGSGDQQAAESSAPAPTSVGGPVPGSSESEKPSEEKATESSKESTTESTEPKAEDKKKSCSLSDLEISAHTDQATYAPDTQPTFYMTVKNPTSSDCEIDLDKDVLRFEVYNLATNKRVWSDVDCYDPVQTGKETFEAGKERYFEAAWSRTASAPGACSNRPAVEPGGYFLHAVVGDNPSQPQTFNLR
ncbi:twin transmembrane helix small protein [Corynebacterium tapiri]|uniref:DUF4232 domain-containing protein n=1 Tax=Corynebacterium tapiri TaxID=1448266 RepID=A0A5C4U304_9CORY|nr:twin transmembrane helix small protein [Corynebacterium tapiri]TNL96056.1 hypothetical protein FHE74_08475 [Corynebacterium tapiri]